MRVTVVAENVVHARPIFLIGKSNRLVPSLPLGRMIGTSKGRYVEAKGTCRFAERHSSPITDAVGPLKVGGNTVGVCDAHVSNKWDNVSYWRKRRPNDAERKFVRSLRGGAPPTPTPADRRSTHLSELSSRS